MTNPGQESPDNEALRDLRDNLKDLNASTIKNNCVMTFLTVAIVVLTLILVAIEVGGVQKEDSDKNILVGDMTDDVNYSEFSANLVKVCSFFDKQKDMASYGECLQNYLSEKEKSIDKLYQDVNTAFENRKKLSRKNQGVEIRYEWIDYFDEFPNTMKSLREKWRSYSETLCWARIIQDGPAGGPADDFVICKIFETENLIKRLEQIKDDWERLLN